MEHLDYDAVSAHWLCESVKVHPPTNDRTHGLYDLSNGALVMSRNVAHDVREAREGCPSHLLTFVERPASPNGVDGPESLYFLWLSDPAASRSLASPVTVPDVDGLRKAPRYTSRKPFMKWYAFFI
jgi:hypothetical protein